MKMLIKIALIIMIFPIMSMGQDTYYSIYKFDNFIPEVKLSTQNTQFQKSLYPNLYTERSAQKDINWVNNSDSLIQAFWETQSDTILHVIAELSGVNWVESDFDIYLLRFYPTIGNADPLVLPMGGISDGLTNKIPPAGNRLKFDLIYQLSKRMLFQANRSTDGIKTSIAYHPLMRRSPFRLDNLAMLLAVNTAYTIMGIDSTNNAVKSIQWTKHFPGMKLFTRYFENRWTLTPEFTLTYWLAQEPYSSDLVKMTRTPKKTKVDKFAAPVYFIEGLPLGGQLGFSTRFNSSGQLVIDQIDTLRLAYASGLRTGDIIRRVDNRIVKNHKALIERILKAYTKGGSIIEIIHDGKTGKIIIQSFDEAILPDEPDKPATFSEPDNIYNESL